MRAARSRIPDLQCANNVGRFRQCWADRRSDGPHRRTVPSTNDALCSDAAGHRRSAERCRKDVAWNFSDCPRGCRCRCGCGSNFWYHRQCGGRYVCVCSCVRACWRWRWCCFGCVCVYILSRFRRRRNRDSRVCHCVCFCRRRRRHCRVSSNFRRSPQQVGRFLVSVLSRCADWRRVGTQHDCEVCARIPRPPDNHSTCWAYCACKSSVRLGVDRAHTLAFACGTTTWAHASNSIRIH